MSYINIKSEESILKWIDSYKKEYKEWALFGAAYRKNPPSIPTNIARIATYPSGILFRINGKTCPLGL